MIEDPIASYKIPTNDDELLQAYEEQIAFEMPEDYKDYHQNSRFEKPLVARLVLQGRREEIEMWCEVVDRQAKEIQELFEYSQKLEQKIKELEQEIEHHIEELAGEDW